MPPEKSRKEQEKTERGSESDQLMTTQYLIKALKQLQVENEKLRFELRKLKQAPSGKLGIFLIVPGVLALIFSVITESQVLAFIGLGLTFWGALFFFIKPVKYVKSELLDSTAIASYSTIDRIIKDLKYKGTSYYIPPYPKEVYLPEYLKGLKDMIVFISADSSSNMPSIEEMAKSKFLLKNPKGICVAPPGSGLLFQLEKGLRTDLTKLNLESLCEALPKVVVEDLQVAKEMEINAEKNQVYVKIYDSTYQELYDRKKNLKSVHLLGCPLISAIACAIAKTTGKIVTIYKDAVSPDNRTIEAWYRFVEG